MSHGDFRATTTEKLDPQKSAIIWGKDCPIV
jgi:hypothetical protein